MDTRPIGIFDSGLGGLTAVRALVRTAPGESFVYLGDTKNAPYGDRSRDQIQALSRQNVRFLQGRGVKALLVACNTSTANAMDVMRAQAGTLPVAGVIEPAAAAAVAVTGTGRIGVLATAATVASGAYERAVRDLAPNARVTAVACPRLVPLVESGRTDPADPELTEAVEAYCAPLLAAGVDTAVLGCTHYPLILPAIRRALGPEVALIDSGAASVGALLGELEKRDALAGGEKEGRRQFVCTGGMERFAFLGSAFLGWDIRPATEQVSL